MRYSALFVIMAAAMSFGWQPPSSYRVTHTYTLAGCGKTQPNHVTDEMF